MSKDWQTWYYFGQETVQARFWLHRAAPSVSQIDYVNQFWLALFNSDFCCTLIAYSDMVTSDFWCLMVPNSLGLGLSKEQTYYITMSPEHVSKNYFSWPTDSAALKIFRYWCALSLYFNSGLITNVKGDSNRVQQVLAPHMTHCPCRCTTNDH